MGQMLPPRLVMRIEDKVAFITVPKLTSMEVSGMGIVEGSCFTMAKFLPFGRRMRAVAHAMPDGMHGSTGRAYMEPLAVSLMPFVVWNATGPNDIITAQPSQAAVNSPNSFIGPRRPNKQVQHPKANRQHTNTQRGLTKKISVRISPDRC